MKTLSISLLMLGVMITPVSAQKASEVVFSSKMKFPALFSAGEKNRLIQQCTTEIDSVLEGRISFEKAKVRKVGKCKITIHLIGDTIKYYRVETFGFFSSRKLLKEVIKRNGNKFLPLLEGKSKTYLWQRPFMNYAIVTRVVIDNRSRHGVMISNLKKANEI